MSKTSAQPYIESNVDFNVDVIISGHSIPFSDTPMVGVKRMMFERRGDEVAKRATSCVKYAPNSSFNAHSHPGGEEYLVLSGTFSDQDGDFSQGWYVRNPVGSTHSPFTDDGCEIFVKLSQVPADEKDYFYLDTNTANWTTVKPGHQQLVLWQSDLEDTRLHRLESQTLLSLAAIEDNIEIFVVSGEVIINEQTFKDHSWMRFVANTPVSISALTASQIYIKFGKGQVRI